MSDSILVNLVFSSNNCAFIESRELSNLCWSCNTTLASSSLANLIRDERECLYCHDRKVTNTSHVRELSTYVRTPQ